MKYFKCFTVWCLLHFVHWSSGMSLSTFRDCLNEYNFYFSIKIYVCTRENIALILRLNSHVGNGAFILSQNWASEYTLAMTDVNNIGYQVHNFLLGGGGGSKHLHSCEYNKSVWLLQFLGNNTYSSDSLTCNLFNELLQ